MRMQPTTGKEARKNLTLNGIRTHDLCDTGAMLYQLSYQSHMRAVVSGLALNPTTGKEARKNLTLNGIRTHDLCDTGAMLYQLSYQSHMRAVVSGLALNVKRT
ncbi:hypothetical protein AC249_AIPGENE22757 [Exaiptasia diaphana]|nr:hypothetical protein AC249_AIPGENE22757 [Exaiptasia diaphana]